MSIGTTIKKLRRERDITQEQLAEYIGISSQAVSQWETDKTAPDISQLPLLAHIFDVSTDEILGVDLQKNEEKIQAIIDEAQAFYNKGEFSKAAEILEKGLRQYPRSYKIMENLAHDLLSTGRIAESIELCQKIIAECTDSRTREKATQCLILDYNNSGDRNSALDLVRELPHPWFTQEDFLMLMLRASNEDEREENEKNLHDYTAFLTGRLMMCLRRLSRKSVGYSDEDRIKLLESAIAVAKAVYTDGDYYFFAQFIEKSYSNLAKIFAERNDLENTLRYIEKETELSIHFCTYDAKAEHTSPAVRGVCDGGWIPTPKGNHCKQKASLLRKSELFDFIREEPRFKAVLEQLDKYSD